MKALNLPINKHLSLEYFGYAYKDCLFKRNISPCIDDPTTTPYELWYNKKIDINKIPLLPFGTIVMAHRPLQLQTGLNGRSFKTVFVGCAPEYTGCLLLFNPDTHRTIVRRTFKVIGPCVQSTAYNDTPIIECTDDICESDEILYDDF